MEKSIIIFGILFYGWVLVLNLFMENTIHYYRKSQCLVPNCLLVGIGIFLIGVSIFLAKKYPDKINADIYKPDELSKVLSVVLFLIQIIISYEIAFASGWDAGEVSWQAGLVAAGESKLDNSYFSHYPNNVLITFLYSFAYRFMGLFGLRMYGAVIIVIFQCALSALAGYLLYQVSQKMFCSYRIAFLIWMVYALWIGFMPWYTVTYSDPVGIIFPIVIVWIYQWMENNKAVWKKVC